jgi:hypothetical protein
MCKSSRAALRRDHENCKQEDEICGDMPGRVDHPSDTPHRARISGAGESTFTLRMDTHERFRKLGTAF